MNHSQRLFPFVLIVFCVGCLAETQPPQIEGPISGNIASQLQSTVRANHGVSHTVPHQYQGQEFEAAWELGNALKRSAQLQIKPPASWSFEDVQQAMQVVLADHASNPWYSQIDATILRLMQESLENQNGRAMGFAPETPYEVAVKVKHYTANWFIGVNVQIIYEDGTAIGF